MSTIAGFIVGTTVLNAQIYVFSYILIYKCYFIDFNIILTHALLPDDGEEEEERRPVGRPSTGAVNLNISRSGRGAGRPRKNDSGEVKRSAIAASAGPNGDDPPPKKRGRPSLNNKVATPHVPSGRPRGRPKAQNASLNVVTKDVEQQEDEYEHEDESGEDEEMTVMMSTPKKRGRPSLSDNNKNPTSAKSRGRPKKSPSSQLNDDAVEHDSATELDDEFNLSAPKKRGRGRPKESGVKDANGGDADEDGDSSGDDNEEAGKQTTQKVFKSDPKKASSPGNVEDDADGEGDAGHDNGESVECISDEPSLADA